MLNKDKLKGAIIAEGKTLEDFANCLGITYTTLYRKMNGTSDFTRNEIQLATAYLHLSGKDVCAIFFA